MDYSVTPSRFDTSAVWGKTHGAFFLPHHRASPRCLSLSVSVLSTCCRTILRIVSRRCESFVAIATDHVLSSLESLGRTLGIELRKAFPVSVPSAPRRTKFLKTGGANQKLAITISTFPDLSRFVAVCFFMFLGFSLLVRDETSSRILSVLLPCKSSRKNFRTTVRAWLALDRSFLYTHYLASMSQWQIAVS